MNKILVISIFVLSAFLFSCQKKLDIDIPDSEKHIVLNGIITTDSLIYVNVTKSKSVLSNEDVKMLDDANVKLFGNDLFIENLTNIGNGVFMSSLTPEIGVKYEVTADYENLQSVNSEITLKNPEKIISIDTILEINSYNYEDGYDYTDYRMKFKIKIKDKIDENNYYFISLMKKETIYNFDEQPPVMTGYNDTYIHFDSNDPIFERNQGYFSLNGMYGLVFSDELFNGQEYIININSSILNENYYNSNYSSVTPLLVVSLLTVNQDIYRYITSFNLNQQSGDNPFSQPVQIFSNVEKGLGLFSGYTMDVDTLLVEIEE